jgi:hypothetical protein
MASHGTAVFTFLHLAALRSMLCHLKDNHATSFSILTDKAVKGITEGRKLWGMNM